MYFCGRGHLRARVCVGVGVCAGTSHVYLLECTSCMSSVSVCLCDRVCTSGNMYLMSLCICVSVSVCVPLNVPPCVCASVSVHVPP